MNSWFFVESYFNWKQDFNHNFKYLGIDVNKFRNRTFCKGDKIFMYISKLQKFSDIREIVDTNLQDKPKTLNYDRSFDKCLQTELIIKLEEEHWIKLNDVNKNLSFFLGQKHIGFVMLSAPFKINENDSKLLNSLFNN